VAQKPLGSSIAASPATRGGQVAGPQDLDAERSADCPSRGMATMRVGRPRQVFECPLPRRRRSAMGVDGDAQPAADMQGWRQR
jgi:hypothetical protein